MPLLSIIMPVYNAERFVRQAIESLLVQTFHDFELLIIDDASTDRCPEIIRSFTDPRIKILTNEQNRGIVYSRNRGLMAASGKFIAPFDSDDIAMPEKFEKQIRFLQQNPKYGLIGSWVKIIDEHNNLKKNKWRLSASAEQIPAIMLFRNYFVQSSVVVSREAIPAGGYSDGYDVAEDYKLWVDIARNHKVWNYPGYLLRYRIHPDSATNSNHSHLHKMDTKMFDYIFQPLGLKLDESLHNLLFSIKNHHQISDIRTLHDIGNFLFQIIRHNENTHVYSHNELVKVVFNRYMKSCYKACRLHFRMLWAFITSPLLSAYLKTII